MKNPVKELEKIESYRDRIDAVAADLVSKTDHFKSIEAGELVDLLGIQLDAGDRCDYYPEVTREELTESVSCYLQNLEGEISESRLRKITAESEAFDEGRSKSDAKLKDSEWELIVNAEQQEKDYPLFSTSDVWEESTSGVSLIFQSQIGDAGAIEEIISPYAFRDGERIATDGYVAGDPY